MCKEIVFILLFALLGSAMSERPVSDNGPPLVPSSDERILPSDNAFTKECLNGLHVALSSINAQVNLETSVLSQSDVWGTIWRADFTIPGVDVVPLTNRVVCWRNATNRLGTVIAAGQHILPLSPSPQK
jgi:hypothetical protein